MNTTSSTNRAAGAFAASVSRALRQHGILTLGSGTSRMREGVRVTAHGPAKARVVADLDRETAACRLADEIVEALHEAGYRTERTDDNALYVHRGGTSNSSTDARGTR